MALANFSLWDAGRSGRSERSGRSGRAVAENYPADTAYLRHRQVRAATRNDVVPLLPHGQSANSPYRARDKALSFSLSLSPLCNRRSIFTQPIRHAYRENTKSAVRRHKRFFYLVRAPRPRWSLARGGFAPTWNDQLALLRAFFLSQKKPAGQLMTRASPLILYT